MHVAPATDNTARPRAGQPCHTLHKSGFPYTPPDHSKAITNWPIDSFATIFRPARLAPINIPANHPSSPTKKYDHYSFTSLLHLLAITLIIVSPLLSPTPARSATPVTAAPSTWRWPLNGSPRILRRFAPPPEPWLTGHRGIDLAAPATTPVLAAGQGTIGYTGSVAGRGVVTVDHPGGLRTTYLPVTAAVRQGDPVSPGDHLGTVEPGFPHCPESCLHWGLRRATAYLDPLLLLGHARIRLLPYWHVKPPPSPPPPPLPTAATPAPSPHHPPNDHTRGRSGLPGDAGVLVAVGRLDEEKRPSHQPLTPVRPNRHYTPRIAPTGHFSLRSTATPVISALGIAALLTVLILLTLLRHRIRPKKSRRNPAGGRHSARSDHAPTTDTRYSTTGQHRKPRRNRTHRQ